MAPASVVVPYVAGSPTVGHVELVLRAEGLRVELAEVEPATGYTRLLARLWARGATFVLVEHDIIPWPGAVRELLACTRSWCAFPYRMRGGIDLSLGCTKFDAALLNRLPLVGRELAAAPMHPWGQGRYEAVDGTLDLLLRRWGEEPHRHGPPVAHLNPNQRKEALA